MLRLGRGDGNDAVLRLVKVGEPPGIGEVLF